MSIRDAASFALARACHGYGRTRTSHINILYLSVYIMIELAANLPFISDYAPRTAEETRRVLKFNLRSISLRHHQTIEREFACMRIPTISHDIKFIAPDVRKARAREISRFVRSLEETRYAGGGGARAGRLFTKYLALNGIVKLNNVNVCAAVSFSSLRVFLVPILTLYYGNANKTVRVARECRRCMRRYSIFVNLNHLRPPLSRGHVFVLERLYRLSARGNR